MSLQPYGDLRGAWLEDLPFSPPRACHFDADERHGRFKKSGHQLDPHMRVHNSALVHDRIGIEFSPVLFSSSWNFDWTGLLKSREKF